MRTMKMKRSNQIQSSSPRNNWRSYLKWIGSISMNWFWPSKEDHPKVWSSSPLNQEFWWDPGSKGCGCLACGNGRLLSCRQGWSTFGRETYPILFERLCFHMVKDGEVRRREDPWLQMGILQGAYWVKIHSQELRLLFEVQTTWPCECKQGQLVLIHEGLFWTHARN